MGFTVMARPPAPAASTRLPVASPSVGRPHCLDAGVRPIEIPASVTPLKGTLAWPCHPSGFVLIARARESKQARLQDARLAAQLRADGLGTLQLEESIGKPDHGLELQAERLMAATEWLAKQPETAGLPLGYLATRVGAAAAPVAANSSTPIVAVGLCGGHGDGDEKPLRHSPPDLVRIGGSNCVTRISGAGPRFEQPDALNEVGRRAAQWFVRHLVMEPAWRAAHAAGQPIRQSLPSS